MKEKLQKLFIEKKDERKKDKKGYLLLLVLIIILMVSFFIFRNNKLAMVETMEIKKFKGEEEIVILSASGYITPKRKATLSAKVTERVKKIFVEEGFKVKEGELLAQLDDSQIKRNIDKARNSLKVLQESLKGIESKLNEAEKNLKRGEALYNSKIIDESSLDRLKAEYEFLKSEYLSKLKAIDEALSYIKLLEMDVENCKIVAPFDGVIVSKDAQEGELVSPLSAGGAYTRTGIVTLVDMDSLEGEVDISESNISKIQTGEKVYVVLDAYPEKRYEGVVRTIIPSADRQKATIKVKIEIKNKDEKILPDMGIRCHFIKRLKNIEGFMIPKEAIVEEEGKKFLFKVQNSRLKLIDVLIKDETQDSYIVTGNLSENDKIVTKISQDLKNGMKVRVK